MDVITDGAVKMRANFPSGCVRSDTQCARPHVRLLPTVESIRAATLPAFRISDDGHCVCSFGGPSQEHCQPRLVSQ